MIGGELIEGYLPMLVSFCPANRPRGLRFRGHVNAIASNGNPTAHINPAAAYASTHITVAHPNCPFTHTYGNVVDGGATIAHR